jgi:hypothetical protein
MWAFCKPLQGGFLRFLIHKGNIDLQGQYAGLFQLYSETQVGARTVPGQCQAKKI